MYKVVLEGFEACYSLNSVVHSLTYYPGVWTRPKFGKIFVFEHAEYADRFRKTSRFDKNNVVIYECEVVNPRPLRFAALHMHEYMQFWDMLDKEINKSIELLTTPEGTIICDAIRLTRKVL